MTISTLAFSAINVGGSPNDGSGESLRSAFIKVNQNYSNIETIGFDTGNIYASGTIEAHTTILRDHIEIGNVLLTLLPYPTALINAVIDADDFSQFNIQNVGTGNYTSSDMVCSTSDANDETGYINMGINGQNYSDPTYWTISGGRDGYLYVAGGNLTIGTDNTRCPNKSISMHVGGLKQGNIVTVFYESNVTLKANLVTSTTYAPTTSSSGGSVGQIAFDSGNIYVCVATNTWKRAALSTF